MSEEINKLNKIEKERFWEIKDILENDYTTVEFVRLIEKECKRLIKT